MNMWVQTIDLAQDKCTLCFPPSLGPVWQDTSLVEMWVDTTEFQFILWPGTQLILRFWHVLQCETIKSHFPLVSISAQQNSLEDRKERSRNNLVLLGFKQRSAGRLIELTTSKTKVVWYRTTDIATFNAEKWKINAAFLVGNYNF